jgi:hypothetical protein
VARGNSSVEAWGNSSVVASDTVRVSIKSALAKVSVFGFASAYCMVAGAKATKKSVNATIIKPKRSAGNAGWLQDEAVKKDHGYVILFKRVSADFKTQENTPNQTLWNVGSVVEHANWKPKIKECGEGKFHACSRPYFCNEFRDLTGDRYIAIKVAIKDLYAWTHKDAQYPHKVAFRKGKVLYECDKMGKKL